MQTLTAQQPDAGTLPANPADDLPATPELRFVKAHGLYSDFVTREVWADVKWFLFKGDFRSSGGKIVWGFRRTDEQPSGEWFTTRAEAVAALATVIRFALRDWRERSRIKYVLITTYIQYAQSAGHNILWTLDGETWLCLRRMRTSFQPMTEADVQQWLNRLEPWQKPEIRRINGSEIPADLLTEKTRVL